MSDVPYQQEPQIAQLQAERENAVAYDQDDRVAAIDKQLAELGVKADAAKQRKAAAEDAAPVGESGEEAKRKPPQGRSSRPTSKTAE